MNCKPMAEKVLAEIFGLTDEAYLFERINRPVEKAVLTFSIDDNEPVTQDRLISITGDFIRHIYDKGAGSMKQLSQNQARAEAMAIIDRHYRNSTSQGYYAAYLDATNPDLDGLNVVVSQLADIITAIEREKHIRWVYATYYESMDWPMKIEIVDILIESWKSFLPDNLLQCPPARLADYLPEIINMLQSADSTVAGITGHPWLP